MTILGTGEQGWQHALAMNEVRHLKAITLWGRDIGKAQDLAARIAEAIGIETHACPNVAEACAESDIICTTTASPEPVLLLDHVAQGVHINAVGSSRAGPTEIDPSLVPISLFIPDHREGVIAQGSEYLDAVELGIADERNLGPEIGEILAETAKGRTSAEEITIYKSLGSIVQDIAAAEWLAR